MHRLSAVSIVLLLLLSSSPFIPLALSQEGEASGEQNTSTDNDAVQEEEEEEQESLAEKDQPCVGLRGLENALCRTELNLKKQGQELPECTPGERHTGLQRAYCMIKNNRKLRENRTDKSGRRSTRRAQNTTVRSLFRERQRRFRQKVDQHQQKREKIAEEQKLRSQRTTDERIEQFLRLRQMRRKEHSDTLTKKALSAVERRSARLRTGRARLQELQKTRRTSMEERRERVREEANSPRLKK